MPDARAIISGDPGSVFTNDTDKPLYQIHAAGYNTCAVCWSYSEKIARYWPIPIHRNCRCRQSVVKPGQQASKPFIDYQQAVKALPADQQAAVMGKALFRLWDKGVIQWSDAVQPGHIRTLQQVVSRQRLSVKTMVAAGVNPTIAQQAWDAVHTAEHRAVEAHRRELLSKLHAAGVNHELVVKHVGEKLASRVNIAAGPSYTTRAGIVLPGIQAQTLVNPADLRKRHADELAALLGGAAGVRRAVAAMRKKPEPKPPAVEPSKATLAYADEGWDQEARRILGRPVTTQEIVNLAGAPDGRVSITTDGTGVYVSVKSDKFELDRYIAKDHNGKPYLHASSFHVKPEYQGQGIGADVFGRMVESARKAGISKIRTLAARANGENGYYTWARFGYDGPIPADLKYSLPKNLADADRISDLMTTPEGSAWWKTHGRSIDLTFDLTPGSKSLKVWDAYRKAKAQQKPTG